MISRVVIVGATPNQHRYAFMAGEMLMRYGYKIIPVGIKKGELFGEKILNIRQSPPIENVDTITMYIGKKHQPEYYDYLLSLAPKRIIFNPGTENEEFYKKTEESNIEIIEGCTLVMLRSGEF
ncbi:MAG: CoA-binding protein [Flammeovirgaceae bacterium]|nr:CoA-binding protein [Flammeovirgaceae bacterium]